MFQAININSNLVQKLIADHYPQWKNLNIKPVNVSGHDNRMFHLGDNMLVRLPSAVKYVSKIKKEQQWLPKIAPQLSLSIPTPIAMGSPDENFPWHWSIYNWIDGESANIGRVDNIEEFATTLAQFLKHLQKIDIAGVPEPGKHNSYRGGSLSVYATQTREAIEILKNKINATAALDLWKRALNTKWSKEPVWIHGDMSIGNLIVRSGKLSAVIDFGGFAVGDPACDYVIAWTYFDENARAIFRQILNIDESTWLRAKAWALWKALIITAGLCTSNSVETAQSGVVLERLLMNSS